MHDKGKSFLWQFRVRESNYKEQMTLPKMRKNIAQNIDSFCITQGWVSIQLATYLMYYRMAKKNLVEV